MTEKPNDTLKLDSDRASDLRRKIKAPLLPEPEPAAPANTSDTSWYLEAARDASNTRRISLLALPFRVGRRSDLELVLPGTSVSKLHAEIYAQGDTLHLRDLGSTNGTFHNRKPVEAAPLREGDVIHFGDMEFRLGREAEATQSRDEGDAPQRRGDRLLPADRPPARRPGGRLRGPGPGTPPRTLREPPRPVPDRREHGHGSGAEPPPAPRRGGAGGGAPRHADALPEHPSQGAF